MYMYTYLKHLNYTSILIYSKIISLYKTESNSINTGNQFI